MGWEPQGGEARPTALLWPLHPTVSGSIWGSRAVPTHHHLLSIFPACGGTVGLQCSLSFPVARPWCTLCSRAFGPPPRLHDLFQSFQQVDCEKQVN
jgi:hypothetical protein